MAKQELLEVPPPESPVLAARREYIHKYVNTLGIHSVNCLALLIYLRGWIAFALVCWLSYLLNPIAAEFGWWLGQTLKP